MRKLFLFLFLLVFSFPTYLFAEEEKKESPVSSEADNPELSNIEPNPIEDFNLISEMGFVSFRADEAKTLDDYTNTTIEFDIPVNIDAQDITNAFLILSVYDVDLEAELPEIDKVYLNGHYIGNLTGNNNAWSFTTFPLRPEQINGISGPSHGINKIRIEVDFLKSTTFWVLCDWGTIKANIGFQVVSMTPYSSGMGSNQYEINIKFSEELDENSLAGNITLTYLDSHDVRYIDGEIKYDRENNSVTFLALSPLNYGTEYTIRTNKNIRNKRGAYLKIDKISTFVPLPTLKAK